jgi:hypothetical protein
MLRCLMVIALTLAGCSSISYGEFDGKSTSDARDVVVVFVDGQLVFDAATKPAAVGANVLQRLPPGRHMLEVRIVESEPDHKSDGVLRELVLDVAPCTRYRFVGKTIDGSEALVADGEVAIADCEERSNRDRHR